MKRLLLTLICCSPLVLSPASCFALDSTLAVSAEIPSYQKYGPIRYYESLWSVSKKLRPNRSVSVQQTLVAIYKLNPAVFVAGDINHLIENSVINVPTYQFIKQQTNQEAIILINKYSNLNSTQTANIKRVNENIAEPLSGTEAKNPATDAVAVMTAVTQELAAGNAPSTEILNSASNDDKNYLANSQLRTAKSLENPGNVSLIKAATSLAGDAQQTDQVNAALPAAEMQSGSEENNPDNGSLPADSAAAESDTVSPIQLQALKNEL
ncbi:MAG TPA: FimV/HubP family polar landmark protein, partial [Psychromonas sp.]